MSIKTKNEKLGKVAFMKLKELSKTDVVKLYEMVNSNKTQITNTKNELEKLKNKRGLCPQSLTI